MSIRKYIAYLRTVETGSITQAANELGYTQSAVSKMISDLEQDWQVKLLTRNHSGIEISSDGMVLLPTIREIVKDYEDLPEILKDFHQRYPNIQIQLLTGEYYEISEWLRRGAIDCGFLVTPVSNDFEPTPILHDTMVAILPQDHPMAHAPVFPLEQLPHETFVRLMEMEDYEFNRILDQYNVHPGRGRAGREHRAQPAAPARTLPRRQQAAGCRAVARDLHRREEGLSALDDHAALFAARGRLHARRRGDQRQAVRSSQRGHLSFLRVIQPQVGTNAGRFNHRAIAKPPPPPYTEAIPVIQTAAAAARGKEGLYHGKHHDRGAAQSAPPEQQGNRAGYTRPRARRGASGRRFPDPRRVPLSFSLYYIIITQCRRIDNWKN